MKLNKGDRVRLRGSDKIGTIIYRGATSVFVDFDGFQTLLNFPRVEKVK